jgi:hypothetical protein
MALAICLARQGQQRSRARIFHALSCAFALSPGAEFRVGAVGLFLGFWFSLAPVGSSGVHGALITLIGKGGQPGGGQLALDAPDPGGLHVVDRAGQRPGHPQELPGGTGENLQVHPVAVVLAGEEWPVRGHPVGPDQGAVQDREREPGCT